MKTRSVVILFALLLCSAAPVATKAATKTDALAEQIKNLQKQIDALKETLHTDTPNLLPNSAENPAVYPFANSLTSPNDNDIHFVFAKTSFQLYGHFDLSLDVASKGIKGRTIVAGDSSNPATSGVYTAKGNLGYLPAISSNSSYFGVRGSHALTGNTQVVFQIETQIDVAATPGTINTNSTADNAVRSAFGSRDSYVGFAHSFWGSLKIGKEDSPYKTSTASMDPFTATVGDYNAIMGNTGGDIRTEFDVRAPHAIWYDSPDFHGFSYKILYAPGQNRDDENADIPSGEPSCSGGQNPINGGAICGDGSYGDLFSASTTYTRGHFLGTIAGALHKNVNRTSDELPLNGGAPKDSVGTADEYALKAGIQYAFPTRTILGFIFEDLHRSAPKDAYNERSRYGGWLTATQYLTSQDAINLGWAHAGKTPGDPGDQGIVGPDGTTTAGPKKNAADLFALGYKHLFKDHRTTIYAVYAALVNQAGAHYALGAGGHGVTTNNYDATLPAGGLSGGGGIGFSGATVQAFSIGMTHDF